MNNFTFSGVSGMCRILKTCTFSKIIKDILEEVDKYDEGYKDIRSSRTSFSRAKKTKQAISRTQKKKKKNLPIFRA